jgi:D-alanyl-D-alanine carboxypeptidase/D-alanyl-D-alanine-endopeptidase (penicillin-binding protein 4)
VLVGAGDPTLTAAPDSMPGAYPDAARIGGLAAQVRQAGVMPNRVLVDGSLFSGPAVSPAWAPGDVPSNYAAPITAAMVDGARDGPTNEQRSTDPTGAAGRALAAALGLPAASVSTGRAPAGARVLATVASPPLRELVEQMLQQSDNVIAECLARLIALAKGMPATFAGAAGATRDVLQEIGVTIGARMYDGSGLAAADQLAPSVLVDLLELSAYGSRAALHDVIAALPVAGWQGTLADRYGGSAAAGLVRAKTGTLTGVSTLAGVVRDRDGRLLAFSLVADGVGPSQVDMDAAERALDAVAATLASCGCR